MLRPTSTLALVLAIGLSTSACGGDDDPPGPSEPAPVAVTETFSGTVTTNGAMRHEFVTQRAGSVTATLTTLSPDTAVLSLALGTWNGQSCQLIIARDETPAQGTVIGEATAGNFCVRLSDPNGKLTEPVSYDVSVTHF